MTFRAAIIIALGFAALTLSQPVLAGEGHEKSASKAAPHGLKARSTAAESFIEFAPAAAAVFGSYRPEGLMHFEYGLDIEDPLLRQRAMAMAPRLRDAYGAILAQYAGSLYTPGQVPDADYLSRRMQVATDRILGRGRAKFLIATLMVQ